MVYEIDDTIMGGLQMYTESEFMDMSLASRVTRINQEIEKLSMWEQRRVKNRCLSYFNYSLSSI